MKKVSKKSEGLIIKLLPLIFFLMVIPLISTILHYYLLPRLYNIVNSFTGRGEDHDCDIDFINTYIMFFIYLIIVSLLMIMIPSS